MNISQDVLRKDTVALIRQIEAQIDQVVKYANGLGVSPYSLRTSEAGWAMAPLLQAKATAYNTLVLLQEKK